MDPDKALVRTVEDGFTNLAIGEPFFLRKFLPSYGHLDRVEWPEYPPHGGTRELKQALANRRPGWIPVVTNGAKQALLAAFYALKVTGINDGPVTHRLPHWPSYPTLASLSGRPFVAGNVDLAEKGVCSVISAPNNPDSWQPGMSDVECTIWDAAYASPAYGWLPHRAPVHSISVWSVAKLTGLSGIRVGWLFTKDPRVADAAADYVEKTTSGVDLDAQHRAEAALWYQAVSRGSGQGAAWESLKANAELFRKHIRRFCTKVDGLPATNRGMFAWFRAGDPFRLQSSAVAC